MNLFSRLLAHCLLVAVLSTVLLGVTISVRAQTAPEVTRGLAWLVAQSLPDGSLQNERQSIATPLQNRAEVAQTLKLLATLPTGLATSIAGDTENNTDYLARKVISLSGNGSNGGDVSAAISLLAARQNVDGGFGALPFYASTAFDTAITLIAFKTAGRTEGAAAAINYLQSVQQADGSFQLNGSSDLYTGIYALAAFRVYADVMAVGSNIQSSTAYLMAQQSAPGVWNNSVFYTALIYPILHDFIPLAPTSDAVTNFLRTAQQADGSWSSDPYLTALALRALMATASSPANPGLAQIKGRLLDAQTRLPLAGVLVSGSNGISKTSDAAGSFLIQNLSPGTYQVSLALSQYQSLNTSFGLVAGQVLDLGTVLMTKGGNASTGTVFGTVRNADNQALSGVSIFINDVNSALTDASGSYQVSNVAVGSVNLRASKSGYASAAGSGAVSAGNALIFSPVLASGAQTNASMQGVVVRASDSSPLAGVLISLSGSSSISTLTDAQGKYKFSDLASGPLQIRASIAGYDTVVANAQVTALANITFSPKMYLTGKTPAGQNAAGVQGVVMDASTNVPLSGVEVIASVSGQPDSRVTTGADGRFTFTAITANAVTLNVNAASYVSGILQVPLQPLQTLDVGQIRLRKTKTTQLVADLTVSSASRTQTITDPQSLVLSGKVVAVIANIGSTAVVTDIEVMAFYDVNRNGVFDENIDLVLGRALVVGGFQAANSQTVVIPVSGNLPFRDAPIQVWADSKNAVIELNKGNNIRSTAFATELIPSVAGFDPVLKWAWTGSPVMPSFFNVMTTPVVVPLYDTNNDGKIDQNDVPSVTFIAYEGAVYPGVTGVLRIVGGKDGKDIVTVTDPQYRLGAFSNLASADLDGSGHPVIIGVRQDSVGGGLIAFNPDGSVKWISPKTTVENSYLSPLGGVSIADLDGDGKAEIIYGNQVFNSDGSLRWTGAANFVGQNVQWGRLFSASLSVVADINKNGNPVVLAGASAYDKNGNLLWKNDTVGDGFVGVANLTGGAYPQIVVVAAGSVYLLDRNGAIIWGPVAVPGGGYGGPPTIADMDGDGIPEIGVAGASQYTAFRADGSVLWTSRTQDYSSNITGSTVYDFEGNGRAEVLYGDEATFRIYNGRDGQVLFSSPSSSGTALEYPLVVDVDNDGHADFLVVSNDFTTNIHGVRAYQGRNNDWVNTRAIWNQHAFHGTNINDNGSVPKVEENSWEKDNSYRANRSTRLFSCVTADVLLNENFSQTSSIVWTTLNGRGNNPGGIVNGQLQRSGPGASAVVNVAWHDYVAEVKLQFPNGASDEAGLAFRVNSANQWYGLSVRANSLNLVQYDQGIFTILQQVPVQLPNDVAAIYSLKVEVIGNTVKAYLNNSLLINYNGLVWLQGGVGTQQANVTAKYSLITVTSYAPPVSRDMSASVLRVIDGGVGSSKFTIRIGNSGSLSLPSGVPVTFYGLDVTTGLKKILGSVYTKSVIQPGQYEDVDLIYAQLSSISQLIVNANDDGTGKSLFPECDSNNNAVSIPLAALPGSFGIAITTNLPEYAANSNVQITGTIANHGSFASKTSVQFQVQTLEGVLVANLPSQLVQVDKGAQSTVFALWNTGGTVAGNYRIVALLSTNGLLQATASTTIKVLGDPSLAAKSTLVVDKQKYTANEAVQITSRVINQSANLFVDKFSLTIKVLDSNNAELYSKNYPVTQLAPGLSTTFNSSYTLKNAAAGSYRVVQILADANGLSYDRQEVNFVVSASSETGAGLVGTLATIPKELKSGESLSISFSATNNGNSAFTNLPLTVRIIDPVAQAVLAELPYGATLPIGVTFNQIANWVATSGTGGAGGKYVVVLVATVGGKTLTLAQDIVNVTPGVTQPTLNVTQTSVAWQNVLVFSRCKRAADELAGLCGLTAFPLEDALKLATCDLDRATALDQYLTGLGLAHKVTSSGAEFLQAMRSGLYNTYWISNGATSLRDLASAELRAVVVRGGGLVIDGLGDGRNQQLTQCAGVNYRGKYTLEYQPLAILDGLFTAGDYSITAAPIQLQIPVSANGSVTQAKLGPVLDGNSGIISATLGSGKSLAFGFDLADTLRTQKSDSRWLDVTQKSFAYLKPGPADVSKVVAGEIFTLDTNIRNSGQSVQLQVIQKLPIGAQIIATEPSAQLSATGGAPGASWNLTLPANGEVTLRLRLRAPTISGTASIASAINLVKETLITPLKSTQFDFTVRSANDLLIQLNSDIAALTLSTTVQTAARNMILAELARAQLALGKGHNSEALRRLLTVQSRLTRIDSGGIQAATLARLIATVQAQSVN